LSHALSMVFIVVVSGAFAGLYVWRLHVDYRIFVLNDRERRARPSQWYWTRLTIVGVAFWASHAIALGISREVSQALVRILLTVLSALRGQLFSVQGLFIAVGIIVLSFAFRVLRHEDRDAADDDEEEGESALKGLGDRFLSMGKDLAKIAVVVIMVYFLLNVFTALNDYVMVVSPQLGEFIGSMIACAAISAVTALFFVAVVSRAMVGAPLRRRIAKRGAVEWVEAESSLGERTFADVGWPDLGDVEGVRPVRAESGDELMRKVSWPRILAEVNGNHLKEAVWYVLIFTFVPCLLLRWALFLPSYPLGSQAPFMAVLVNLHITGFMVGGILDWLEVGRLRTYRYRRTTFPHDWQVDENIRFTRVKSLGILIPVTVVSWALFLWAVVGQLSQG